LWAYRVVEEGALYLPNAPGTVAIVREQETGIAHIRGDSYKSVAYGQGFSHAQTRLWQLERTKRVVAGEISELFGPETLLIDKFMRQLGLRRLAEESWKGLDTETKEILTAYADGINDCVLGTNFLTKSTTGRLLPPEFYAFGITL